jgi:hypothetical protein
MAHRPLRKILDRRTLLLAGGVFSIAFLAWGLDHYHLVRVPYPTEAGPGVARGFLYGDAEAKRLILGLTASGSTTFDATTLRPNSVIAVTAAEKEGGLKIALEDVTELSGQLKLMKRGVFGWGHVNVEARPADPEPFALKMSGGAFIAEVGRSIRGLRLNAEPFRGGMIVGSLPDDTSLYRFTRKPDAIPAPPSGLFSQLLNLPFQSEIIVSRTADGSDPFVLHFSDYPRKASDSFDERAVIMIAGQLQPHKDKLILPDQTLSIELRDASPDIAVESREIPAGTIKKYLGPDGRQVFLSFVDHDGDVWLSNDGERLMQTISTAIPYRSATDSDLPCIPVHGVAGLIAYPQRVTNSIKTDFLSQFRLIVNDAETGLFTFCGYLP